MFSAERVLEVLERIPDAVVDGGWGVDALVGSETRPHDDLDLVVRLADEAAIVETLAVLGYAVSVDERPTRVVVDDGVAPIDLHLVTRSEFGATQALPGARFFTYVLDGTLGTIRGTTVRCLSAPMQVLSHCGYEPDANDHADMAAVAVHTRESLPPPYVAMGAVELRPATLSDVAAITVVRLRSWRAAYTGLLPQRIIDSIDLGSSWLNSTSMLRMPPTPSVRVTVVGRAGEVHAFSVISACRDADADDGVGEIRALYADPTAWGSGAGAALLIDAVDRLHEIGFRELRLWTLRENGRARSFYERFGWKPDGTTQTIEQAGGAYVEVRYRLVG